jgi:hypothetical protein
VTRFTPELLGVAALGFVILATAPFSIWMGGAVGTFTGMFAKVMLIFILMVNTLTSPKRIEQFIWLIVIATAYIAFRAVLDYGRGVNLIENGRVRGAVGGMFRNPNDLALNMVAVVPLAVGLALRRVAPMHRLLVLGIELIRRRPGLAFAGALALMLALPLLPSSYVYRVSSITDASRDETGSREARSILLREAFETFKERPLTGIGAGQFQNYNPEKRQEAWRETHNVLLQVAAELGIVGLIAFVFLIGRGAYAPIQTRRLLRRASGARVHNGEDAVVTPEEHNLLDTHSFAVLAALVGWFACAFFASVAYHWTFYYLLALAVTPRDVIADRLAVRRARRRPAGFTAVVDAGAGARA